MIYLKSRKAVRTTAEQEKYISQRKAPSKKERVKMLLNTIAKWQKEGDTAEQAIERLTVKQYDFLIDCNVNLDNFILTDEQIQTAKMVTRAPRPKDLNYKKKYPQNKQDLYIDLENFIKEQGATIHEREKVNFRDLDFSLNEIEYKIVLSNPRSKK